MFSRLRTSEPVQEFKQLKPGHLPQVAHLDSASVQLNLAHSSSAQIHFSKVSSCQIFSSAEIFRNTFLELVLFRLFSSHFQKTNQLVSHLRNTRACYAWISGVLNECLWSLHWRWELSILEPPQGGLHSVSTHWNDDRLNVECENMFSVHL